MIDVSGLHFDDFLERKTLLIYWKKSRANNTIKCVITLKKRTTSSDHRFYDKPKCNNALQNKLQNEMWVNAPRIRPAWLLTPRSVTPRAYALNWCIVFFESLHIFSSYCFSCHLNIISVFGTELCELYSFPSFLRDFWTYWGLMIFCSFDKMMTWFA